MANDNKVIAQTRDVQGSTAAGRLRRAGLVPGIVNPRRGKPKLIQMNRHDFELLLQHHASESLVLDVEVDGTKALKVLLREVQHDPISGQALHADFQEISMTARMQVHVPLELVGEAAGVNVGGVLDQHLRELEVECLPGDMPERIDVDVSALNIGDTLRVSDLSIDPTMTVVTDASTAVAGVLAPRVEEEPAEDEAAAEEEGAEPEVIGEKKEQEEEQEPAG